MIVGVLRVRLILREAVSLKDKRQVVKGIKDRVRNRFNVSIAEIGAQDARQRAELGLAAVSTERRHAEGLLQDALSHIRCAPGAELASHDIEFF
ncbi:MAG TPA: DUF503 domain-containing protein [Candidatus Brocadiia bacterium]|nr:DUF503 domain-containing protein [Candidatus Brocadiia bacterium]